LASSLSWKTPRSERQQSAKAKRLWAGRGRMWSMASAALIGLRHPDVLPWRFVDAGAVKVMEQVRPGPRVVGSVVPGDDLGVQGLRIQRFTNSTALTSPGS